MKDKQQELQQVIFYFVLIILIFWCASMFEGIIVKTF